MGGIVEESLVLKDQLLWYTSMLGRKTSVDYILKKLTNHGITKIAVTEFKQGTILNINIIMALLMPIYSFTERHII